MTKELYTIGETANCLAYQRRHSDFTTRKKYSAPFTSIPTQDTDTIRINSFILSTG